MDSDQDPSVGKASALDIETYGKNNDGAAKDVDAVDDNDSIDLDAEAKGTVKSLHLETR